MKAKCNSGIRFLLTCFILASQYLFPLNGLSQENRQVEERLLKQADENIEKYRKGDVSIEFKNPDGKSIKNARVEVRQTSHDFLFGCIIFDLLRNEGPYKQALYKERFKNIFNLAVFPFYWPSYEATQGFPGGDKLLPLLEWCKANGITTKGHPLVWATKSGAPKWLTNYSVAESEELLKSRVLNITSGFRDKIELFDVVNEPINCKTWKHKMENFSDEHDWGMVGNDGVRDSISLIADYVEKALQWAHQGNPKATLLVNEYKTLADKGTRKRYDDLLTELRKRNAPFSGIGIQAHEPQRDFFNPQEVWNTFDLYSRFGVPIYITEFLPVSSGVAITGGYRTGTWTPEVQAEYTEMFVKLCFGHPAVASVNWWGFSDREIWLPGGGLVDAEYRPKPVYLVLDKLINQTWKTNASLQTDSQGAVSFRGFYGEYEISLTTTDGKTKFYKVHVSKNEDNKRVFIIN